MIIKHHASRSSALGAKHLKCYLRGPTFLRIVDDSALYRRDRACFLPWGFVDKRRSPANPNASLSTPRFLVDANRRD